MSAQIKCRRLEGKVSLVTAATAGIGLATAERLAREGSKVFICSRKQANVDEAVQALRSQGLEVSGCACHVGDEKQRQTMMKKVVETYGPIHILISNAAVSPSATALTDTPHHVITKILDTNVSAALGLIRDALPHMSKESAAIVLISSVTAFNPPMPIGMYGVSKTALLGLTKGLAAELAPSVRVNCVAPGIVPTKLSSYLVESPELAQAQADATLLKRLGTPGDMAAAVAFLVSDDAAYITGETLVVAGGMQSRL